MYFDHVKDDFAEEFKKFSIYIRNSIVETHRSYSFGVDEHQYLMHIVRRMLQVRNVFVCRFEMFSEQGQANFPKSCQVFIRFYSNGNRNRVARSF